MKPRVALLAAVSVAAIAVVIAVAQDEKKPETPPAVVIAPVPPDPKVDYAFKQEKKNFTEKFTEKIRFPLKKKKGKPQEFAEKEVTVTFEMVYVPGGTFQMGSPDSEAGRQANEGPVNGVTVRDYWLAKIEVTWDVFDVWYRNAGLPKRDEVEEPLKFEGKVLVPDAITRPTNPYVDDTYGHEREGKPAICMSHHSAMVFCHWVRLKTGKPYRLPTEAEWEYAARAGGKGAYGFDPAKEKLEDYAWFKANSKTEDMPDGTTHTPGGKKANAFGLDDMHGNVAEWTLDLFDEKLYAARAKDPAKALAFTAPKDVKWGHVVKGGSWSDDAAGCRTARRVVSDSDWMDKDPNRPRSIWWLTERDTVGFRIALPADEYPELKGLKPAVVKAGL